MASSDLQIIGTCSGVISDNLKWYHEDLNRNWLSHGYQSMSAFYHAKRKRFQLPYIICTNECCMLCLVRKLHPKILNNKPPVHILDEGGGRCDEQQMAVQRCRALRYTENEGSNPSRTIAHHL
jgi:hypothetical protein